MQMSLLKHSKRGFFLSNDKILLPKVGLDQSFHPETKLKGTYKSVKLSEFQLVWDFDRRKVGYHAAMQYTLVGYVLSKIVQSDKYHYKY